MSRHQYQRTEDDLQNAYHDEAERKEIIRKRFYRDVISWVGTIITLLAINFFLVGGMTWSRFPIFFIGLFMGMRFLQYISAQQFGGEYPRRSRRRDRRRYADQLPANEPVEDYTDVLLRQEEREPAELKDYRKPEKAWRDEDLV